MREQCYQFTEGSCFTHNNTTRGTDLEGCTQVKRKINLDDELEKLNTLAVSSMGMAHVRQTMSIHFPETFVEDFSITWSMRNFLSRKLQPSQDANWNSCKRGKFSAARRWVGVYHSVGRNRYGRQRYSSQLGNQYCALWPYLHHAYMYVWCPCIIRVAAMVPDFVLESVFNVHPFHLIQLHPMWPQALKELNLENYDDYPHLSSQTEVHLSADVNLGDGLKLYQQDH